MRHWAEAILKLLSDGCYTEVKIVQELGDSLDTSKALRMWSLFSFLTLLLAMYQHQYVCYPKKKNLKITQYIRSFIWLSVSAQTLSFQSSTVRLHPKTTQFEMHPITLSFLLWFTSHSSMAFTPCILHITHFFHGNWIWFHVGY